MVVLQGPLGLRFRAYPKALIAVLGFLGEGLGFGGLRFWGSMSLRVYRV